MKTIIIVGGGISGASLARFLAEHGLRTVLHESSARVGGMCRETIWNGHLVPELGPHIFRTSNAAVWAFLGRFGTFVEAPHMVATFIGGEAVPFPPLTADGPVLPHGRHNSIGEYLVTTLGKDVFSKYYEPYTLKRWGVSAFELSTDMIPLIPVFRYPTGFFSEARVGIPSDGYSRAIENMLDHKLIGVHLRSPIRISDTSRSRPIVWTGRLDMIASNPPLNCAFRGVRQSYEALGPWPSTSASVINYPGPDVAFIRRTNYHLLLPWAPSAIGTEFPCEEGYPAYPVRTNAAVESIRKYFGFLKSSYPNVIPHGRLGRFEYISMAQAIEQSLALAQRLRREMT
jgi:UDP-galactopyranose mutase